MNIVRFNDIKIIINLEVYSLAFYNSFNKMLKFFIDRDRHFISLIESYYREYDGTTFRYIKDGLIRISV
jgi:hypothetical protein